MVAGAMRWRPPWIVKSENKHYNLCLLDNRLQCSYFMHYDWSPSAIGMSRAFRFLSIDAPAALAWMWSILSFSHDIEMTLFIADVRVYALAIRAPRTTQVGIRVPVSLLIAIWNLLNRIWTLNLSTIHELDIWITNVNCTFADWLKCGYDGWDIDAIRAH